MNSSINIFNIMQRGGPIMWPLFCVSVVAVSIILERIFFVFRIKLGRSPNTTNEMMSFVKKGDISSAKACATGKKDFVLEVLSSGLEGFAINGKPGFVSSVLQASGKKLKAFSRGISALDTIVTLAPLLGLLGTVTGMIRSFGLLGEQELGAPTAITGGIAEALLATAFGLGIAILSLIPLNFLNAKLEEARGEIEDAVTELEMDLKIS